MTPNRFEYDEFVKIVITINCDVVEKTTREVS